MRRISLPTFLLLAAATLAGGCSTDDAETTSGSLRVEASIDPNPPVVGQNTMHIELYDAAGKPVSAATVTVDPQMPSMGHGSNETAVVTETAAGKYDAFPVTFTMPGDWEVSVEAKAGSEEGTKVFSYQPE